MILCDRSERITVTEQTTNLVYFPDSNLRVASFQHRLGSYFLDLGLAMLTLGIGWFIWALIVWGEGQTPAKKILKIRVYDFKSKKKVTWGHMAVREFLLPLAVGLGTLALDLVSFGILGTIGIIAYVVLEIVFYFTKGGRTLRDIVASTLVVNECPN
jgi:uncharacterized RDD family membrane protein YckC